MFEDLKFIKLTEFVRKEYRTHKCYPPGNLIFEAFNRCPFEIWVPLIGALQALVVRKTSGNLKLSQKFLFLRIDVTTAWQNTFHTAILLSLIISYYWTDISFKDIF